MSTTTERIATNKLTSIAGAAASISAVLLALVPADVLSICGDAIAKSQNPVMVGALLGGGILLSSIGPSLLKK
jgi:hypothetical protein